MAPHSVLVASDPNLMLNTESAHVCAAKAEDKQKKEKKEKEKKGKEKQDKERSKEKEKASEDKEKESRLLFVGHAFSRLTWVPPETKRKKLEPF